MPNPELLEQVARDSEGCVVIKSGLLFTKKNDVQTGEPYVLLLQDRQLIRLEFV
jgi:hypothetical protein